MNTWAPAAQAAQAERNPTGADSQSNILLMSDRPAKIVPMSNSTVQATSASDGSQFACGQGLVELVEKPARSGARR